MHPLLAGLIKSIADEVCIYDVALSESSCPTRRYMQQIADVYHCIVLPVMFDFDDR